MIAAEGEQKASRALREAAETIADSHSALQVGTFYKKKSCKKWPLWGNFKQLTHQCQNLLDALQNTKKCTPPAKKSHDAQLFSEPFASLGPLEISAQNANDVDLMLTLGKKNATGA